MPRSEPTARPIAKSLRLSTALRPGRLGCGLRLRRGLRLRLCPGLWLRFLGGLPEAGLEVVEDEPGGGLDPRRGCDQQVALADDEQAAVAGGGLEVREVTSGGPICFLEQNLGARGDLFRAQVGQRRG